MRRIAGVVGGIAVVAALLVGCGSAPPPSGAELWRAEISNAIPEATSDWEREILERSAEQGFISDEDFAYAEQMYLQCMADRGVPLTKTIDPVTGGRTYATEAMEPGPLNDAVPEIQRECSIANGIGVRSLYASMRKNPDFRDPDELMAECLAREGLVDAGYSGEDFDRDMTSGSSPYDLDSVEFRRCIENPSGA